MKLKSIKIFFQQEYAVGVLLMFSALLAIITINSPWSKYYHLFINLPIEISIGKFEIDKPLLLWINDGFMAMFFLLIGLEVKYELMKGELNSLSKIALPGISAIGGMVVPALIYVVINSNNTVALHGWAIPVATDIAFAIGVLAFLGSRVPPALKVFLLALAIFDDFGAILIIALFYTDNLSLISIVLAIGCLSILMTLNYYKVTYLKPYLIVGVILWICVLKSGVHATLAGVLVAFTIPLNIKDNKGRSPLVRLQHKLHNRVDYIILPAFAFANAGIELSVSQLSTLFNPIPFGVFLGLFIGKQLGVFGFIFLAIKLKLADMPSNSNWKQLYGISLLCGIGFTMSFFIGGLAFDNPKLLGTERIGILSGSILSAIFGYIFLRFSTNQNIKNKLS